MSDVAELRKVLESRGLDAQARKQAVAAQLEKSIALSEALKEESARKRERQENTPADAVRMSPVEESALDDDKGHKFVLVTDLTRPFSEAAIRELFAARGAVVRLHLPFTKSWALVEYETARAALKSYKELEGLVWPPKNQQTIRTSLCDSWDAGMDAQMAPAGSKPPKSKQLKSQSQPVVLQKLTKSQPVLKFTILK